MKRTLTVMAMAVALLFGVTGADAKSVPNLLTYHSTIYDGGGNPVSESDLGAVFRITDLAGATLYEEHQTISAVNGRVAVLVGNGLTAEGAPTGGVPQEALEPTEPRFITVDIEGLPAYDPMEIASVPYSMFSEKALSVEEGVITSASIADGAITFDDLSEEVVAKITDEVTEGKGGDQIVYREELRTIYREPASASSIGVLPEFIYSGSNHIQGVLKDLDIAIKHRDERLGAESAILKAADADEAKTRTDADAAEAQARINADADHAALKTGTHGLNKDTDGVFVGTNASQTLTNKTLESPSMSNTKITNLAGPTVDTDAANKSYVDGAVGAEASIRSSADSSLQSNIGNEAAARSSADSALSGRIDGHEKRIVDLEDAVGDITSPLPNQIYASAWGDVACGLPSVKNKGGNIGDVTGTGVQSCNIPFGTPLASEQYIVVTTNNDCGCFASALTRDGFTMNANATCSNCIFIVMGP